MKTNKNKWNEYKNFKIPNNHATMNYIKKEKCEQNNKNIRNTQKTEYILKREVQSGEKGL